MSTESKRLRRLLMSNTLSMFGLVTVAVFVVLALLEVLTFGRLTPYDPYAPNFAAANLPPSLTHFFGTDFEGRDIFSQVIAALPVDMGISIAVVVVSALVGIALGTLAGYFRGAFDEVIMRLTDMFLAFPQIIMSLAIAATLGPSLLNVSLSLIVVWWPSYVRLVRGAVLAVTAEDYVSVSKALNSSFQYIVRKDALPNVLPSVLVYATTDIGSAMLTLSTLGYLNVGIPPAMPELGKMVSSVTYNLYLYPSQVVIPALVVMVMVAGFSFLGEGLRESLDVKLRPHIRIRGRVLGRIAGGQPEQESDLPPATV
ncbi:MAG TPA: ABC transporter permease [Nitrososphaerales archaeon]|nr:ABC transporter permease [Nitrososphaerales archaeon]